MYFMFINAAFSFRQMLSRVFNWLCIGYVLQNVGKCNNIKFCTQMTCQIISTVKVYLLALANFWATDSNKVCPFGKKL